MKLQETQMNNIEETVGIKVSVIIPVYNVKQYIRECLDSLINQTLREIEIICVDDGSTDGTLDILRQYESKDQRIKIIQQENQYAGVARNNGMKHVHGKYMIFLDADDFFDETMLEKTYYEAERCNADVVLFGGQSYNNVSKEIQPMPWLLNKDILPQKVPFSCRDTDGQLLNAYSPAPWTKLFLSEFIRKHNLQFQALQNSNDVFFIFSATCLAERITFLDEKFVYYRRGTMSSLQSLKGKQPLCFLEAYNSAYKLLKEQGIYEYVKAGFRSTVISGCLYNYDSNKDKKTKQKILEAFLSDKFKEMDLFGGKEGEYRSLKNFRRLKNLIEEYLWEKNLKQGKESTFESEDIHTLPEISIIIPIYNDEENIEKCINSISQQSFQNFEIVCVDQDSQDATLDIIFNLKKEEDRLRVLWQEEKNIGRARSRALEHIQGKYVLFLEPENVLGKSVLEKLYKSSEKKGSEVTLFTGFHYTTVIKKAKKLPKSVKRNKKNNPISDAEYVLSKVSMELWTKMFQRQYLEREGLLSEKYLHNSLLFGILSISRSSKINIVESAKSYYYVKNQNDFTEDDVSELYNALYDIYDELKERGIGSNIEEAFCTIVIDECMAAFRRIKKTSVKTMFLKELSSKKFGELAIFNDKSENYKRKNNSGEYNCLEGLRKGYRWKQRMDIIQRQDRFNVVAKAQSSVTPKVSVIVPCFNMEKYIEECLDSLVSQTLKEIEIICVDDGSTDRTKSLLYDYVKREARLTIVEQENAGLSVARNVGVKNARGEYICFVDSDDLMELTAFEELYHKTEENKLDILFYDGESFFESEDIKSRKLNYVDYYVRKNDYSGITDARKLMCDMFENKEYRSSSCMQIINRQFFLDNDLWFHPGIVHEDNPFTFKGMLCAKRASHISKAYYLRRVRENSIMTKHKTFSNSYGYFASFLDMWDVSRKIDFTEEQSDTIANLLVQMLNSARSSYRQMESDEKNMFECLDVIERNLFLQLIVNYERQLLNIKRLERTTTQLKKNLKKIKISKSYKFMESFDKFTKRVKQIFHLLR